MPAQPQLRSVVEQLEKLHGEPRPPQFAGPLEMILWENVVYLAGDNERQLAFDALRKEIGLTAAKILSATPRALLTITRLAGILPEKQVEKLRRIAETVQEEFGGDLNQVLKLPVVEAKRALKKFPGIGEPGAEKILLFTQTCPIFTLESNGLRVLLRLGFGKEEKNYTASYRSAQKAVETEIKENCSWLIRAHQLLRIHGQEVCRRTRPMCDRCPLTKVCLFYSKN